MNVLTVCDFAIGRTVCCSRTGIDYYSIHLYTSMTHNTVNYTVPKHTQRLIL
jgi:hypothetical protein